MLSDIHDAVRAALGKGTSLDTQIVAEVRRAARFIERQRTYQYMRRFGTTSFDMTADFPYIVDTPNEFKAIKLVRLVVDGQYYRIPRAPNFAELSFEDGVPTGYELDGTSRLVFNANPEEDWELQIFYDAYTSWPTADSATNWLIRNGEDALLYQTLRQMSAHLRDPRQVASLAALRDEAFRGLLMADEEMTDSDYNSKMVFTPEGGLDRPEIQ